MDSVNVWNMDVSEGMAIMASNYSIIYKGSQWAMHKGNLRLFLSTVVYSFEIDETIFALLKKNMEKIVYSTYTILAILVFWIRKDS